MSQIILFLVLLAVGAAVVWVRRRPADSSGANRSRDDRRPVAWYASRGRPGLAILGLIGLIGLWALLTNLSVLRVGQALAPGDFVVRVASFNSSGQDQRQGTIVADQLLDQFKTRVTTPMNVGRLTTPISSVEEARAAAQANNIDVLIWGEVAEGTTADQAGLMPRLLWNPDEPYVPRTWQGYDGHFAVPDAYDLALAPLNGPAVLSPLIDSLNHFARGDVDKASANLDILQRDYGNVLRTELPSMLRAIISWAEGKILEAEIAAQEAVESVNRPEHWNNLGAVRLDQQKLDSAQAALTEAVKGDPNLAPAHANLGRLFLDRGQPAEGLPNLRSAVSLAPQSPPIIATLGEAYRRSGRLREARTAVDAVLALDSDNGPALAERSMLSLTPVTTATGQLEWELEAPQTRPADQLAALRADAETGIAAIEGLRNEYLRKAAAYGAALRPDMQRLAETQAAILEQELLNRRYQLMLVQIEQGRVLAAQRRSALRRFWDTVSGRRTPLQEAIANSTAALKQEPSLGLQYEFHNQHGRAAYLSDNPRLARQEWDATQQLADNAPADSPLRTRPEAHYGRARLLLDDNQRDEARAALDAALAADQRFFPAHELLARMAIDAGQWADATEHHRWLAENRPWIERHRLDLAHALRKQGDNAAAEAQLLPLANANNVDALIMLAAMYRELGKPDEAAAVLQRALTVAPQSPAVHEALAELAIARNQPEIAETELRRTLELDPQRSTARIALGQLYAGPLGRPADAAEQFRAAVENKSTDPQVHRQLGEVLLHIGNPQSAVESFRNAIELAPNSHEAYHGLATAQLALGRIDAATKAEQRALELANGNYTLAIVGMGDIEREQRNYESAIQRYSEALERDPRLPAAYLGLGKAAAAQGQQEIALSHYRQGLEIDPNNVPLLLGMGDALLQQNDIAGAQTAYDRVKQLAPGNAAALAGSGRAQWKAGDTNAALDTLEQAVQINPNDAATFLLLGDIHESREEYDPALDAYTRAIEVNEDNFDARFRRGNLLLKLQRTDAAIKELEDTVELNDNFAQGHYWLGRAYRAAGRFADARQQFERAIALQRDYFEARFFLGRTLDELGQAPDAVTTYAAIISEAPTNDTWRAEAQRELDRIR